MESAPGEEVVPTPTPKRQVSYNQKAVLCPACQKRIRLNNSGRVRIHLSAKTGFDKCMGSNADPFDIATMPISVNNEAAPDSKPQASEVFQKEEQVPLFSDLG